MEFQTEKLRIDKYLWAIRFFKTRSLATEACKAGRIKMEGQSLKPSYLVKLGDIYQIQKEQEKKTIQVKGLLERRADAKTVINYFDDLTPIPIDPKTHSIFTVPVLKRDRGAGRPTKRERRDIDGLQGSWED